MSQWSQSIETTLILDLPEQEQLRAGNPDLDLASPVWALYDSGELNQLLPTGWELNDAMDGMYVFQVMWIPSEEQQAQVEAIIKKIIQEASQIVRA